jgi:NADH dehydrogenase
MLFLIGFRNRVVVLIQWAWLYMTFDRGARLITEPLKEPLVGRDAQEPPSCREPSRPAAT